MALGLRQYADIIQRVVVEHQQIRARDWHHDAELALAKKLCSYLLQMLKCSIIRPCAPSSEKDPSPVIDPFSISA